MVEKRDLNPVSIETEGRLRRRISILF